MKTNENSDPTPTKEMGVQGWQCPLCRHGFGMAVPDKTHDFCEFIYRKIACPKCGAKLVFEYDTVFRGVRINRDLPGGDCDDEFLPVKEPKQHVIIRISGGVAQVVDGDLRGVVVDIYDYDIDGCDPDNLDEDDTGEPCCHGRYCQGPVKEIKKP